MTPTSLVEFLLARLAERERGVVPSIAAVSGGPPGQSTLTCWWESGSPGLWHKDFQVDVTGKPRAEVERLAFEHGLLHLDDEARLVLAEVEAKRRIVEFARVELALLTYEAAHAGLDVESEVDLNAETTLLRLLAVPFAAHPDYDKGWRP